MNSFGAGRNDEIQLHPTVKPVAMIADAIKDVSQRNGIVLDLFGGSGTPLQIQSGVDRAHQPVISSITQSPRQPCL